MLTYEDCVELSDLTEEEIEAIAEHEHIPRLAALELGNYLVQTPEGEVRVRRMIADDIGAARERGDRHKVATLKLVLKHYLEHHVCRV
jgi:hypothetical protein